MKTVDRTMSAQQQVTDEGTGPGKSHNGALGRAEPDTAGQEEGRKMGNR